MGILNHRAFFVVITVVVSLIGPSTVWAADRGPVARLDGNRVVWSPEPAYTSATLSVSLPDGTVIERSFSSEERIVFSPFEAGGRAEAGGLYTWQLVLSPVVDETTRREMDRTRVAGDGARVHADRERGALPSEEALIHSGNFRVASRALVDASAVETSPPPASPTKGGAIIDADDATEDMVVNDDLIVMGSHCVGFDCVNGESFGFDTLRLKENNLRLHFYDTSTSSSFPTNDWRIVANDSANGGASYLAIEDSSAGRIPFRVMAGARNHALYVDAQGDLGLGTSTPVTEIHASVGDTPTLRLDQNGSSGWAPQIWDVAGNESNFFIRDATNGSALPFRIKPGAPSNSLYIDPGGDVGLGTASPDASLHVLAATGGGAVDSIHLQNNGPSRIKISNTAITNTSAVDQDWILNSNGTFRISGGTDTSEFTLDAEGNLTVTGSYKVDGTTLNVPDFVFDDDYRLMPLDDLSEFVESNRHLPGVPSAEEITSDVLDMTRLQLQLLQKIEELTLYTLEQQATIEQLNRRVEELEAGGD
jgi:hypothetical protein